MKRKTESVANLRENITIMLSFSYPFSFLNITSNSYSHKIISFVVIVITTEVLVDPETMKTSKLMNRNTLS